VADGEGAEGLPGDPREDVVRERESGDASRWREEEGPTPPTPRERRIAVLLFLATLGSVYWTYGTTWMGGNPFTDPRVAWGSLTFSVGLMCILLAHEMGHYLVARRHGFALSLPYFLPVPFAFGTLGAIIRLRSLPRSRTALLEMGAAGPLAGLAVAVVVMVLGIPGTAEQELADILAGLPPLPPPDPSALDAPGWLDRALALPPLAWLVPSIGAGEVPLMILANPLLMDLVGIAFHGAPPGRYAALSPLAMAGWVGCFVTSMNLLPIGQLDGGHIFNALWPERSRLVSRVGVAVVIAGGVVFLGWMVWGLLLLWMGAWRGLPVARRPALSGRARWVAGFALLAFALSFMPRPIQIESVALPQLAPGAAAPADEAAPR
jgi:membrane-associated protease RseP (regulator of RpoE activity)